MSGAGESRHEGVNEGASGMPQLGNSGGKIRQNFAVARHIFRESLFNATSGRSAGPSISESLKPQTDEQPRARTS
jgi:hypothetical protein